MSQETSLIKPIHEPVPRPACQFYNMVYLDGKYIDRFGVCELASIVQFGIRSTLRCGCTAPIQVWYLCPHNDVSKYVAIITFLSDGRRFFPSEFWPYDDPNWQGLSYDEWCNYVTDDSRCPRPWRDVPVSE